MSINIPRGNADAVLDAIMGALRKYEADHEEARIDIYRQNAVSVRIRIVDPRFKGQSKVERSNHFWSYLEEISDETQSDISTVLLLTPDELKTSFANMEFEDPIPSTL